MPKRSATCAHVLGSPVASAAVVTPLDPRSSRRLSWLPQRPRPTRPVTFPVGGDRKRDPEREREREAVSKDLHRSLDGVRVRDRISAGHAQSSNYSGEREEERVIESSSHPPNNIFGRFVEW
uniref:Putative secreted protein n=1 Tax=Anopheles marajoara TaxID=58244 RepID=A0A2M4C7G9_9DIPT